jgi:hypothetical protein
MSTPSFEPPLLIHEAIEEEKIPNYSPYDYYSTYLGQVLNERYQTITKLGWGFGSTVWLADDLRRYAFGRPRRLFSAKLSISRWKEELKPHRYFAVKIGTCNYSSTSAAEHELKLSERIAAANPSHPGAGYIRTPIDNFQIDGSHGIHICLVYHPMRETLYDFRSRFKNQRFPPQILKLYMVLLL